MEGYVDVFLLAVPRKNLAKYRKMAQVFGKIIGDHGALEYREWVGDDLKVPMGTPFTKTFKLKPGEVLISSVVEFKSKSHRNQVNRKAMNDPRMKQFAHMAPVFDMKRMHYGGFKTIVKM